MLLRDGLDGLEVFMQQRNHGSEFVAGLHVFPGGGVDPEDTDPAIYDRCIGLTDDDASARTGETSNGLSFWVAAVRETFEEAGLLLAQHDGEPLAFDDALTLDGESVAARFTHHRSDVDGGHRTLLDVCETEDLQLDMTRMHYHSRWVTPLGAKRRYDTRFFVAPMPAGQTASKDNREAIADLWISPARAVAQETSGDLQMLIPTLASLRELATHSNVESALAAAASHRDVPAILPKIVMGPNGREALLPGDVGYDA